MMIKLLLVYKAGEIFSYEITTGMEDLLNHVHMKCIKQKNLFSLITLPASIQVLFNLSEIQTLYIQFLLYRMIFLNFYTLS